MIRLLTTGLIATLLAGNLWAGERGRHDYAKVTGVEPITRTVTHRIPRESCWNEDVLVQEPQARRQHTSATGTVLGGLIGAAIGNSVGHKKVNRRVGAVAGALLGASIGHDISRRNAAYAEPGAQRAYYRTERRCELQHDVEYEERIVGYRVSYRYGGEIYHTRMDHDPGNRIRVQVNVRPIM